jgi:hypothetical protein
MTTYRELAANLPDLTSDQWAAIATFLTRDGLTMDEDFPIFFEQEDQTGLLHMCAAGLGLWVQLQNLDSYYKLSNEPLTDAYLDRDVAEIQVVEEDIPS